MAQQGDLLSKGHVLNVGQPPDFNDPNVTFLMDPPRRFIIDGRVLPPILIPAVYRDALTYEPTDDDVFVCTYPKCGTTWTQAILYSLYNGGAALSKQKSLLAVSPMLELFGAQAVSAMPRPRIIKSHLRYDQVPLRDTTKCVFVVRNPKDCAVSFYHHCKGLKHYGFDDGTFDQFFEQFIKGHVDFGEYFEYMHGWMPHLGDEKVLFLKYEDMIADLPSAVEKIAMHLGGRALESFNDERIRKDVIANCQFSAMNKASENLVPQEFRSGDFNIIRKGVVGDWRNYFSKEQSDRLDERLKKEFHTTVAANWWSKDVLDFE